MKVENWAIKHRRKIGIIAFADLDQAVHAGPMASSSSKAVELIHKLRRGLALET